jgi:type I restriction enzyme R subunit
LVSDDIGDDWRQFISERRDSELEALIDEETLKPEQTRAFVAGAFRDGAVPTTGTAITKILPPASRFSKDNNHSAKKQRVLGKLIDFFDRYIGLI